MIFSGKHAAVAEFASRRLTVTTAKSARSGEKAATARATEKYDGYVNGEFKCGAKDIAEALGKAVESVQKAAGFRIKELYVGVPAAFVKIVNNSSSMTFGGPKKISGKDVSLLREMANNFGDEVSGYRQIDSMCRGVYSEGRRLMSVDDVTGKDLGAEYTFIFVSDVFADVITEACAMKGLTVRKFISTDKAEVVGFMTQQQRKNASVLVDCGDLTTDVAVCDGAGFAAMESISDGGGYLSEALSKGLGLPYETADLLKEKINLNLKCKPEDVYKIGETTVTCNDANDVTLEWISGLCEKICDVLATAQDKLSPDMTFCLTGGGLTRIIGAVEVFGEYFDGVQIFGSSKGSVQFLPGDDAAGNALIAEVSNDIK